MLVELVRGVHPVEKGSCGSCSLLNPHDWYTQVYIHHLVQKLQGAAFENWPV